MKAINLKEQRSAWWHWHKLDVKADNALCHARLCSGGTRADEANEEATQALNDADEARCVLSDSLAVLESVLGDVQKRSQTRKITAFDIINTLGKIELKLNISNRAMNGVRVYVDLHAAKYPNAYTCKGTPQSTQFCATFKNGHWILTDLYRGDVCAESKAIRIIHTDDSKAAIIKRFSDLATENL